MIEIITPATATALTTLDAVKADMGIANSAQDSRITALISQYSAAIVGWCGRSFARETIRETTSERCPIDGLMLSRWPIASLTSATVNGTALDAEGTLIDAARGILYRRATAMRGAYWPRGESVVTYVAGYLLPGQEGRTLPHDVERAAIILIKGALMGADRDPLLRSERSEGVAAFTYFASTGTPSDAMPLDVQGLLAGYQIKAIG